MRKKGNVHKVQMMEVGGKWNGPTLTSMRETASSMKTRVEISKTLDYADRMRNDDALLSGAEQKRLDRNARNARNAKRADK